MIWMARYRNFGTTTRNCDLLPYNLIKKDKYDSNKRSEKLECNTTGFVLGDAFLTVMHLALKFLGLWLPLMPGPVLP